MYIYIYIYIYIMNNFWPFWKTTWNVFLFTHCVVVTKNKSRFSCWWCWSVFDEMSKSTKCFNLDLFLFTNFIQILIIYKNLFDNNHNYVYKNICENTNSFVLSEFLCRDVFLFKGKNLKYHHESLWKFHFRQIMNQTLDIFSWIHLSFIDLNGG